MKRIILLTSVLAISAVTLKAQTTRFGIKAGIQNSSFSMKISEDDINVTLNGAKIGFTVGGVADISFSDKFSVQPNLLFTYKPGSFLLLAEGDVHTFSIDVPINLLYKHNGFFIGAGPNFSYGLSSKLKPFDDADEDVDLYKEEGGEAPFKRFEAGVNGLMGFQFENGLTVSANFTRGFSNIANTDVITEDVKMNYKQVGLSIGYTFGGKKAKK